MTTMNQTLENPFPPGTRATDDLHIGILGEPFFPQTYHMADFMLGNSTYINGEYQCRFWYSIGWGELAYPGPSQIQF